MPDVGTGNQTAEATPASFSRRKPGKGRGKLFRAMVLLIVLMIVAAGAYYAWKYFGAYESTDDAQVDGHINAISARISGYVLEVPVEDEQYVTAGDVLARIDPKDYAVAVANAEADLAASEASFQSSRTRCAHHLRHHDSQLKNARSGRIDTNAALIGAQRQWSAAEARLVTAQAEVREAKRRTRRIPTTWLATNCSSPKTKFPSSNTTLQSRSPIPQKATHRRKARRRRRSRAKRARRAERHRAGERPNCSGGRFDPIRSYSAPAGGGQPGPRQIRRGAGGSTAGARRAGQAQPQLLHDRRAGERHRRQEDRRGRNQRLTGPAVHGRCSLDDIWITADFKETQLRSMKPGQRVTFSVDAYGREYKGKVTGIGGASGSRLSLLPPENATGNYVKVVQRLPVRIDIDPNENSDHRLRPGMSVVPKVYVH